MKLNESIAKIKVDLQKKGIKKTGKNNHAGFKYFELKDFLPTLNELMALEGVNDNFTIENGEAILYVIKGEDKNKYAVPFTVYDTPLTNAGKKSMQDIQYLGALITYFKRYLYGNAFGITDGEVIDSMDNNDTPDTPKSNYADLDEQQAHDKATKDALTQLEGRLDKTDNGKYKVNIVRSITKELNVNAWYEIKFTAGFTIKDLTEKVKIAVENERALEEAGI